MRQDKIATALLDELWDAGFKLNGRLEAVEKAIARVREKMEATA